MKAFVMVDIDLSIPPLVGGNKHHTCLSPLGYIYIYIFLFTFRSFHKLISLLWQLYIYYLQKGMIGILLAISLWLIFICLFSIIYASPCIFKISLIQNRQKYMFIKGPFFFYFLNQCNTVLRLLVLSYNSHLYF